MTTLPDAERARLQAFIAADQARVADDNARMDAALYSPSADEDNARAAANADWFRAHPNAWAQWRAMWAALHVLGVLCLLAVGLGTALFYSAVFGETHAYPALGGAMAGGLLVCAVFAHVVRARQRKAVRK